MRFDFSKRPPRILAHPDNCGSGTWRVAEPIMELRRQKKAIGVIRSDRFLTDDELKALNPDIILVQRTVGARQATEVERYRRACPDAFIVLDLDDLLWGIPSHSPAVDKLDSPSAIIKRCKRLVKSVDRVVLSTDALRDHWLSAIDPDRSKTEVLGPYLPDWFFNAVSDGARIGRSVKRSSKALRVGFAGSITHTHTLNRLTNCIRATSDKIQWVFFGCKPEGVDDLIEFTPLCEIDKYPEKLGSLALDAAIAPYATSAFDYCKTDLRVIELGSLGVPVLHDYDDRGQFSRLNRLLSKPEQFLAEVESLIGNFDADMSVAANRNRYSLSLHLEDFERVWLPEGAKAWEGLPLAKEITLGAANRKVFGSPEPELPGNCGSVTYLSNDGLYPHVGTFVQMTEMAAASLPVPPSSGLAHALHPTPSGLAVLCAEAVRVLGEPDWGRFSNEHEALIDWGEWAAEHGFGHVISGSQFAFQERPGPETTVNLPPIVGWYPRMGQRYQENQQAFQETQEALREFVERNFSAARINSVGAKGKTRLWINASEEDVKLVTGSDTAILFVECSAGETSVVFPPMPNTPPFILSSPEGLASFQEFMDAMGISETKVFDLGCCTIDDARALTHLAGTEFPDGSDGLIKILKA